jgi:Na+/proline symporter
MYINLAGTFLILSFTCITGLIAFAVYHKCDLLTSKKVTKGEQILPYLVMDLLGDYNGLPGLFVACVYSAALSTISSGLNSLAAVCLKGLYKRLKLKINYFLLIFCKRFHTTISYIG